MSFFKIDRKLLNHEFWLNGEFDYGKAWVDLIGCANYADSENFYKGTYKVIKRGQLATSEMALAKRWGWSRGKVHRFLDILEKAEMVSLKRTFGGTAGGTTITIEKYGVYQNSRTSNGTDGNTDDGQMTDRWRTHQKKNKEEIKKNNKKDPHARAREEVPLSAGVVSAFVSEENLDVDPEAFWNYYEAVGWEVGGKPVRNWKALCRTWDGKPNYAQPEKKQSFDDLLAEARRISEERQHDQTGS